MNHDMPAAILKNFYEFVQNLAELSGAVLKQQGQLTWYNKGISHGM